MNEGERNEMWLERERQESSTVSLTMCHSKLLLHIKLLQNVVA